MPPHAAPRRLGLAAVALLLLAVPVAEAHAVRLSSSPAPGDRLATAPDAITITFTEPTDLQGTTVTVVDAENARVDLDDATSSGGEQPTWRLSLRPGLPDGPYRILWQTLSTADGHAERGTVGFAIGDAVPPGSQEGKSSSFQPTAVLARALAYAGLAIAFGAAVFLAWMPGAVAVPRDDVLRILRVGAVLHVVGVALLLAVTRDDTGLSAAAFATTAIGRGLLLRLGLGLAAMVFAVVAAKPGIAARAPPYVALLALAAAAVASARFGHGSLAGTPGVAVDAIHLLAAATWVGGLGVFVVLLGRRSAGWSLEDVQRAGIRFGTVALGSVLALLAAGFATTLAILGPPTAQTVRDVAASPWGRILAAKVGATLLMLGLAVVNRYAILATPATTGFTGAMQRATRRIAPGLVHPLAAGRLARTVRIEVWLGAATLVLAAMLSSISPPSQATAPAPDPLEVGGSGLSFHGTLTVDPVPVVGGTSQLRVQIATHGGEPVTDNTCGRSAPQSCVRAVIGLNGTGESHLLHPRDGVWVADEVLWSTAGPIEVRVVVATAEVPDDPVVFRFTVQATQPNA